MQQNLTLRKSVNCVEHIFCFKSEFSVIKLCFWTVITETQPKIHMAALRINHRLYQTGTTPLWRHKRESISLDVKLVYTLAEELITKNFFWFTLKYHKDDPEIPPKKQNNLSVVIRPGTGVMCNTDVCEKNTLYYLQSKAVNVEPARKP